CRRMSRLVRPKLPTNSPADMCFPLRSARSDQLCRWPSKESTRTPSRSKITAFDIARSIEGFTYWILHWLTGSLICASRVPCDPVEEGLEPDGVGKLQGVEGLIVVGLGR